MRPSGGTDARSAVASDLVTETESAAVAGSADVALRYPGGELPLPVIEATEGSDGFDTSKLLSTTGKVALVSQATGLACNGGSAPCSAAQLAAIVDLVGFGTPRDV